MNSGEQVNAHPAQNFGHRRARLRLLQRERNLLLSVPRLLHGSISSKGSRDAGKLTFSRGGDSWGTSKQPSVSGRGWMKTARVRSGIGLPLDLLRLIRLILPFGAATVRLLAVRSSRSSNAPASGSSKSSRLAISNSPSIKSSFSPRSQTSDLASAGHGADAGTPSDAPESWETQLIAIASTHVALAAPCCRRRKERTPLGARSSFVRLAKPLGRNAGARRVGS